MSMLFSGCIFKNKVNSEKAPLSQLQTHETNESSIEKVNSSTIDETNLVYKVSKVINPLPLIFLIIIGYGMLNPFNMYEIMI